MTDMPSPSLTFTIPSVHDSTNLQCRIFHPATPSDNIYGTTPKCYTRAAIIAHPYAPQGGCYDDPIVESLVETFLQRDYIVGTFNFRGAGSSKSHTSWTGRAEIQDYISLAGLLIHYLHSLRSLASPSSSQTSSSPSSQPTAPISLILGGYSYGALIASLLPPPPAILLPFAAPRANTPIAETRLRAEHLARERHLQESEAARRTRPTSHSRGAGAADTLKPIAIGGEESTPAPSSRTSRESSRKSGEGGVVRRSFETSRRRLWRRDHHHRHPGGEGERDSEKAAVASAADDGHNDDDISEACAMNAWRAYLLEDTRTLFSSSSLPPPQVKTAYLLVSPPLPPVSHFLTGFSSFFAPHRDGIGMVETSGRSEGLVVYGDSDGFTSARKYRRWAAEVEGKGGSGFTFHEVAGAGHFYRERGALEGLLRAVGVWAGGVCFGQGELKA